MAERITDEHGYELMAEMLNLTGVPVPGPGAGMEVVRVLERLRPVAEQFAEKKAGPALGMYADALEFVAGVWARQQKLVIEELERAVERSRQEDGE